MSNLEKQEAFINIPGLSRDQLVKVAVDVAESQISAIQRLWIFLEYMTDETEDKGEGKEFWRRQKAEMKARRVSSGFKVPSQLAPLALGFTAGCLATYFQLR